MGDLISAVGIGLLAVIAGIAGTLIGLIAVVAGLILRRRKVWKIGAAVSVASFLIATGSFFWVGTKALRKTAQFAQSVKNTPHTPQEMSGWFETSTGLNPPAGAKTVEGRHIYEFPLDSYFVRFESAAGIESQFKAITGPVAESRLRISNSWRSKMPFWKPSFKDDSWYERSHTDANGNAWTCVLAVSGPTGVAYFAAIQTRD